MGTGAQSTLYGNERPGTTYDDGDGARWPRGGRGGRRRDVGAVLDGHRDRLRRMVGVSCGSGQKESAEMISPPARDPSCQIVCELVLSLRKRTEPSHIRMFAPPGCQLVKG